MATSLGGNGFFGGGPFRLAGAMTAGAGAGAVALSRKNIHQAKLNSNRGTCCSDGFVRGKPYAVLSALWEMNRERSEYVPERNPMASWRDSLLHANKEWADSFKEKDPQYFKTLALEQHPEILWIGCSDSRVPAESMVQKGPGELFVHRNVANVVSHCDLNILSVLEYAVHVLKVKHVIVCGHTQCGGVKAAAGKGSVGLVDNWIRQIREVRLKHANKLDRLPEKEAFDRLVELNVVEQVKNVCSTSIVQTAWAEGQNLAIHGFVFDVRTGLMKEIGLPVNNKTSLHRALIVDVNAGAAH